MIGLNAQKESAITGGIIIKALWHKRAGVAKPWIPTITSKYLEGRIWTSERSPLYLGTFLAGGSTKARKKVAGGVSRTLPLQSRPSLQDKTYYYSNINKKLKY